jgi:hypothetical protein
MGDPQTPGPIVRAAIHPAIGVARVGNSPDAFFCGPQVVEPAPAPPGAYKDPAGALKRQAALFRVYGYDAQGRVVAELTAENAEIEWTVEVANQKASWYEFQIALDIPEAATAAPSALRNAAVGDRASLAITPGPRTVSGRGQSGPAFDTGTFLGTPVYLGELRTDEAGRLLFLGGHGVSASHDGAPAITFANNEGWHDDVSDGPVTAVVKVNGEALPVDAAWVVTAPPNYAPDVVGVRTLYDLLYDVYARAGWTTPPARPSFTHNVWPVLRRLAGLEWVNKGFAAQFGWGGPNAFGDPALIARLAQQPGKVDMWGELRRQVFNAFRIPQPVDMNPLPWPWIYGDAMNVPADSPRQFTSLTATQWGWLQKWAAGDFVADWDPARPVPHHLEQVPLEEQPAVLDQAALHFCLADAFHPGCEVTWPVRHATMYTSPFRILRRTGPEPDYGPVLTSEIALEVDGPLYGQAPGSLSRWMAVPWQTDTASCRGGYEPKYDPYIPTFWPARVPNQVLTQAQYERVIDTAAPLALRQAAFSERPSWLRVLSSNYLKAINEMVADFGKLGVVEVRPGVPGDTTFPPVMMVESKPGLPTRQIPFAKELLATAAPAAEAALGAAAADVAETVEAVEAVAAPAGQAREVLDAGWDSEEDLAAAVAELHR